MPGAGADQKRTVSATELRKTWKAKLVTRFREKHEEAN